jgi:hypothetical protein
MAHSPGQIEARAPEGPEQPSEQGEQGEQGESRSTKYRAILPAPVFNNGYATSKASNDDFAGGNHTVASSANNRHRTTDRPLGQIFPSEFQFLLVLPRRHTSNPLHSRPRPPREYPAVGYINRSNNSHTKAVASRQPPNTQPTMSFLRPFTVIGIAGIVIPAYLKCSSVQYFLFIPAKCGGLYTSCD